MDKNENGYPTLNNPGGVVGGVTGGNGCQGGCNGGCGGCGNNGGGCGNGMGNGGNGSVGGVTNHHCGGRGDCLDNMPLAYVYAPDQMFRMLYSANDALDHGTLFEELYKPMEVYGRE